jgi:hypothetical protein
MLEDARINPTNLVIFRKYGAYKCLAGGYNYAGSEEEKHELLAYRAGNI